MLEVTYEFLASKDAQNALMDLFGTRFDTETSIRISRIKYQFDKNFKIIQKKYQAIAYKYAELDENKKFKMDASNELGVKIKPDQEAAFLAEIEDLKKIKVEFTKCKKIPISIVKEISPDGLLAISSILEGFDLENETPVEVVK